LLLLDGQWVPDTPTTLHQLGATTIILHQSNRLNPYIDWPFAPSVMPMLADYVDEAAALGMHVKMYFTLGQITNHMTELFALKSLGDEILLENASALPPAQTGIVGDSLAMGDGRVQVRGMGNGLVGVSGAALFCRLLTSLKKLLGRTSGWRSTW